jgi:hypothetical protein
MKVTHIHKSFIYLRVVFLFFLVAFIFQSCSYYDEVSNYLDQKITLKEKLVVLSKSNRSSTINIQLEAGKVDYKVISKPDWIDCSLIGTVTYSNRIINVTLVKTFDFSDGKEGIIKLQLGKEVLEVNVIYLGGDSAYGMGPNMLTLSGDIDSINFYIFNSTDVSKDWKAEIDKGAISLNKYSGRIEPYSYERMTMKRKNQNQSKYEAGSIRWDNSIYVTSFYVFPKDEKENIPIPISQAKYNPKDGNIYFFNYGNSHIFIYDVKSKVIDSLQMNFVPSSISIDNESNKLIVNDLSFIKIIDLNNLKVIESTEAINDVRQCILFKSYILYISSGVGGYFLNSINLSTKIQKRIFLNNGSLSCNLSKSLYIQDVFFVQNFDNSGVKISDYRLENEIPVIQNSFPFPENLNSILFRNDGKLIANNSIFQFDYQKKTLSFVEMLTDIQFYNFIKNFISDDGKILYIVYQNGVISYDISTLQSIRSYEFKQQPPANQGEALEVFENSGKLFALLKYSSFEKESNLIYELK